MTKTNKLKGKTLLGLVHGWNVLIYIYIYIYMYVCMYVRISLRLVQIFKFLVTEWFSSLFLIPLHLDLSFPFISNHKSSESYTWRAEIVLLGLLSHPEHTSKLYPIILVVPPLFMVISSLMRPEEWLPCI